MAARDALALAREAVDQRKDGKPAIRFVPSKVTVTNLGRELPESLARLGRGCCHRSASAPWRQRPRCPGLTVREAANGSACSGGIRGLGRRGGGSAGHEHQGNPQTAGTGRPDFGKTVFRKTRKARLSACAVRRGHAPHGERGDFLKVTATLSPEVYKLLSDEMQRRKLARETERAAVGDPARGRRGISRQGN